MDEATVAKIHDFEGSDLPEPVKLALRFTERWVQDHGEGIDGELLRAMQQHYTDEQIVELAFVVGRYDMAHRFNAAFGLERDTDDRYSFGDPRLPQRLQPAFEGLRAARRAREAPRG